MPLLTPQTLQLLVETSRPHSDFSLFRVPLVQLLTTAQEHSSKAVLASLNAVI